MSIMKNDPFPSAPKGIGMKICKSSERLRLWNQMKSVFESGERPESFTFAYAMCYCVCGQYENEARSLWNFVRNNDIKSIVEVGRNLGGNIFLLSCAAKKLENFLSVDLLNWSLTDDVIPSWWEKHKIKGTIQVCDSLNYVLPDEWRGKLWDFVYIDGGHTGEVVKADIEFWKDKTKFIGFHDFADKGRKNCHKKVFKDIVKEIKNARDNYGWIPFADRANSEIIFRTQNGQYKNKD